MFPFTSVAASRFVYRNRELEESSDDSAETVDEDGDFVIKRSQPAYTSVITLGTTSSIN